MSLLWMEGFDTYAGNSAYPLNGLWAEMGFGMSNANPRTGAYALRLPNNANTGQACRRVFGGQKVTSGLGMGMYLATLPGTSNMVQPMQWRDISNATLCYFGILTTGDVQAIRGSTGLGTTSAPVVTANAYNHLEGRATISTTVGAMELRVNEVTVLNVTGANTSNSGATSASQMAMGQPSIFFAPTTDFDDLYAWDTLTGVDPVGGDVVDFVGDRRVYEDMPDEDGSDQDWSRSSGSQSWALLDEKPPNDDTDYVYTATPGAKVALRFPPLPDSVISVVAVQFDQRTKKTDAGTASTQVSIRSGPGVSDNTAAGADRPMTTAYTYYYDMFQADPDTGVPWTPAAAEDAELLLERTA